MTAPALREPKMPPLEVARGLDDVPIAVGAGAGAGEDSSVDWVAQPATRPVSKSAARLVFMLLLPVVMLGTIMLQIIFAQI